MKKAITNSHTEGAERSAFVSRLQIIVRHWPSADRLARTMGVSPSAFRKWLKGEAEPSRERLISLAEVAQVPIGWLARGDGPAPDFVTVGNGGESRPPYQNGVPVEPPQFVLFPEEGSPGAKEENAQVNGSDRVFIAFRGDWLRAALRIEPNSLTMVTAIGSAMTPTIRDGDLLLLDSSDRVFRRDGIYVIELAGEQVVRRVQRLHDGGVALIADNPCYKGEVVPAERLRDLAAIGRVVWSAGEI